MAKKAIKKYVYEGLGFPVVLKNVPTVEVRGEIVPHINFNALQKTVLLYLCYKHSPLTGNEVRFIRHYLEMTLAAFGSKFACSHAAVLKWEKFGNNFAKIEPTTDICIRLFVLNHLHRKGNDFKKLYNEIDIQQLEKCQKNRESSPVNSIAIDVSEDLALAAI